MLAIPNVAHYVFLRDVWIRPQRAAVASRRATNLATHFPKEESQPPRKLPFRSPWPKWPRKYSVRGNPELGKNPLLQAENSAHCPSWRFSLSRYRKFRDGEWNLHPPTSAIPEMSWQISGRPEIFRKFSRRFPDHNGFKYVLSPNFLTFKEPKNRFQGANSARLCSLAGRYDNPIPSRFPHSPHRLCKNSSTGLWGAKVWDFRPLLFLTSLNPIWVVSWLRYGEKNSKFWRLRLIFAILYF